MTAAVAAAISSSLFCIHDGFYGIGMSVTKCSESLSLKCLLPVDAAPAHAWCSPFAFLKSFVRIAKVQKNHLHPKLKWKRIQKTNVWSINSTFRTTIEALSKRSIISVCHSHLCVNEKCNARFFSLSLLFMLGICIERRALAALLATVSPKN